MNVMSHRNPSDSLPDEVLAMLGVHQIFWRVQECVDELRENDDQAVVQALSKQEKHVIILLGSPQRMGVLAREMTALPSTITSIADGLEEKLLLERIRDPADRRAFLLRLTGDGEEIRRTMVQKVSEMFRSISGLSPEETEAFAKLANKARRNILDHETPEGI